MRKSLYSRLLRRQSSDQRSNFENFCTEILCDLLNRLSPADGREFISRVFELKGEAARFDWTTQFSIYVGPNKEFRKCPDLVCLINGRVHLILEVKISAGFTARSLHSAFDTTEDPATVVAVPSKTWIHQLEDYGQWLNENNSSGGLILLTQYSEAPKDFFTNDIGYGVRHRKVVHWQRVCEWFKEYAAKHPTSSSSALLPDFLLFMREHSMYTEEPSETDIAMMQSVCATGAYHRFVAAVRPIRKELTNRLEDSGYDWGREASYLGDHKFSVSGSGELLSWDFPKATFKYTWIGWGFTSDKPGT